MVDFVIKGTWGLWEHVKKIAFVAESSAKAWTPLIPPPIHVVSGHSDLMQFFYMFNIYAYETRKA